MQVVGVPDPKFGEELCAWIVAEDRQKPATRKRSASSVVGQIAHYKIPRYVRFVEEFPR